MLLVSSKATAWAPTAVGTLVRNLTGSEAENMAIWPPRKKFEAAKKKRSAFWSYRVMSPAPACWNVSSTLPALRSHSAACCGWSRLLQPSSAWLVFGLIARPFGLHLSTTSVFETIVSDVGSNWYTTLSSEPVMYILPSEGLYRGCSIAPPGTSIFLMMLFWTASMTVTNWSSLLAT